MINKEYGSDFHYFYENGKKENPSFFDEDFSFYFSGRVALYNLLEHGIKKYGWKKIGFPSYYCHEVVEFCKNIPADIEYYSHNPLSDALPLWEDDVNNVFIHVDFFGVKKIDTSFLKKSIIIEDLTHNLLSIENSNAHYCFGSLRKQLPIATGGFVYSKVEKIDVQTNCTDFAQQAALQKLTAMFLKSEYLNGNFSDKDMYRELFSSAEEKFKMPDTNARLPKMIESQLLSLCPKSLISTTYDNIQFAKKSIVSSDNISLLKTPHNTEMGLVMVCKNKEIRDQLKSQLVDNKIYPAVLWPHQWASADIDLQDRILFIHADFRYQKADVEFIVEVINKCIVNV